MAASAIKIAVEEDAASPTEGLGATLLEHITAKQGFSEANAPESITNRLIIVSKHGKDHRTDEGLIAIGGKIDGGNPPAYKKRTHCSRSTVCLKARCML